MRLRADSLCNKAIVYAVGLLAVASLLVAVTVVTVIFMPRRDGQVELALVVSLNTKSRTNTYPSSNLA